MTQLLLHTFAHLTGPSFRVKTKNEGSYLSICVTDSKKDFRVNITLPPLNKMKFLNSLNFTTEIFYSPLYSLFAASSIKDSILLQLKQSVC